MDNWLFTQMDNFKKSPAYGKLNQQLSFLSEKQRLILNNTCAALFILFPFFVSLLLIFSNFSLRGEIEMKKEILDISGKILSNQKQLQKATSQIFSANPIADKNLLVARLNQTLRSLNIALSKVGVTNFEQTTTKYDANKITADITFKELTVNEAFDFLKQLSSREKFQISAISISKEKASNLLTGSLSVAQVSQGGK